MYMHFSYTKYTLSFTYICTTFEIFTSQYLLEESSQCFNTYLDQVHGKSEKLKEEQVRKDKDKINKQ